MKTFRLLESARKGVPLWMIWFCFLIFSSYLVADMVNQPLKWKFEVLPFNFEPKTQNIKIKSSETKKSILEILSREKPLQIIPRKIITQPSLPEFKLIGTVAGKGGPSYAFFENLLNREQIFLKEGDLLAKGVFLKRVAYGKVFLSIDGRLLPMEIDYEPEEEKTRPRKKKTRPQLLKKPSSGLKKVLDKREVDLAMKDLNKVMTQARVVPYLVKNKAAGFRVSSIKPGSIYTKVGIKNGDIIQGVNDVTLDSPEKLYLLFQQLRNESRINLSILRRGQRITLPVEIR